MTLRDLLGRVRALWIFPLLAFFRLDLTRAGRQVSDLLWLIPMGILIWTLLEYGLHRFVFHIQVPLRNPRLRDFVNGSHLSHHAAPRDPNKIIVYPLYGFVVWALLYGMLL